MDHSDFNEKIRALVEESLGEDVRVLVSNVEKNNGQFRDALTITAGENRISPTIYLDCFRKRFENGTEISDIAQEIISVYENRVVKDDLDISEFRDFEKAKEHIIFKIINHEKNEELLKDVPHLDYLDLAIVFCYFFSEGELENASILIRNAHMEAWGTDTEALMKFAEYNTNRLLGCTVNNILDYLKKIYDMNDILPMDADEEKIPLYVLSNRPGLFGAGCILYNGLLKDLSEKMDSDLYVFPSSIHEVIIMPYEGTEEAMHFQSLVKEINRTELSVEDILSDSVYYYSRSKDCLQKV